MAQALAQVKRHLGADAVIVHTRQYKRGGILGLGAKAVVEVTAADGRQWPARVVRKNKKPRLRQAGARMATEPSADRVVLRQAAVEDAGPGAGELIRQTYAAARAELGAARRGGGGSNHRVMMAASDQPGQGGQDHLADEMRAVKRLVSQMLRQQRQASMGATAAPLPGKLFDQYVKLIEQEVAQELADEIVHFVNGSLDERALQDDQLVRQAVLERLASLIPADGEADHLTPSPDGRPRTIALIGPTGVGKTTTVAKLAANFKLRQKKNVALITLDTYRIAAVEQLRTYAGIIGVDLHVVSSPERMVEALRSCRGCDVVLMDTAGRSQRDDPKLAQLRTFIQAADPHEVHLVLSLTSHQAVLLEAAERFSSIRTDRIIFTKLDEAVNFGVLLNVARQVNKRLSFVTTGQEVPHDLEPGRSDRLARLMLGEGV